MIDPIGLYRELTALRHIKRFQQHATVAPISVAEHSYYVAVLAATFARQLQALGIPVDVAAVLEAGLWHDAPEAVMGDTPHPVRRRWPAIKTAWDAAEVEVHQQLAVLAGLPSPNHTESLEALLVKVADWCELVLYEIEERLAGNCTIQRASEKILHLLETIGRERAGQHEHQVLDWYDQMVSTLRKESDNVVARRPITYLDI